ncbi:hypothetical protein L195_g045635 [Trifolium pratense]|uniref:Uncharacterized protein n=1 Tax=Trifolium pratense TaxID=57577 RepID=A0A2K3MFD7_TRIPR|nr:hypothetical protein L195_g045635 [Trifolium pratense]
MKDNTCGMPICPNTSGGLLAVSEAQDLVHQAQSAGLAGSAGLDSRHRQAQCRQAHRRGRLELEHTHSFAKTVLIKMKLFLMSFGERRL